MKQHITEDQYNELSEDKKKIWYQWCLDHNYTMEARYGQKDIYWPFIPDQILDFPSIGEMIEFILDHQQQIITTGKYYKTLNWDKKLELCDTLWMSVQEILKND